MPASTILVVEADAASATEISTVLGGASHKVTLVPDATALATTADPDLVILGSVAGEASAADVCRRIRESAGLASVPLLCISERDDVEDRIAFLEAGADDVMVRPFDGRELEARVEALVLRAQRSKELGPASASMAAITLPVQRTVAVFSPKGGSGTTTVATNVAVATAERRPDRVLLVDLDVQFGQAATLLNLQARQSIVDVVRDPAAMREPEILRTYAARHDCGLHLLAAPPAPDLAGLVEAEHVERILDTALGAYDSIVVDAGSVLDERTMAVLDRADRVIVPVYAEIAALKAVHSLLDHLAEVGTVATRVTLVHNGLFLREILRPRDIETALGTTISVTLPYDPLVYLKAANEGVPAVLGSPRSKPAERLRALAATAFGEQQEPDGVDDRRGPRLPSLLRRT